MANAIYPGSFDPVHNGHVDMATRFSRLFDRLVVAVYDTPAKAVLFKMDERVDLFRESVAHLPNVEVSPFGGLVPHFAREVGAQFIARGLRAGFDFETEFEMALMWRNLDPELDVVCMMSALEYQFVHSSRIKEIALLGGDIDGLVPRHVSARLRARFESVT